MLYQFADDGVDLGLRVVFVRPEAEVQGNPDEPPGVPATAGRLRNIAELSQYLPEDLPRRGLLRLLEVERGSRDDGVELGIRPREEPRQFPGALDAAEEAVVRQDHAAEHDRASARRK